MQRLTLAQQIAQLEDTAPADFDPEDAFGGLGKHDAGGDNDEDVDMEGRDPAQGREHYVDVGPSELRKMRDSIADPKYDGIKTSRDKLLVDESDQEEQDDEEQVEGPEIAAASQINGAPSSSESEIEDDSEDQPPPPAPVNGDTRKSSRKTTYVPQPDQSLASSLRDTRAADKLKGKAVSRQLAIWDSLVDARIRLQKSLTAANKLPHPDNINPYITSPTGRAAAQVFLSEALQLSEELFELRHSLLAQQEPNLPPRKKRRIDPTADIVDYESLVGECTAEMVALDTKTHASTLSTLQKWSAKVQAVAPSALLPSSRVSFKGPAHVKSAAELVDEALQDQDKAVRRTWGKAKRIGATAAAEDEEEGDREAFDDRDFYQSILRDVIESKGGKEGVDAADLYANLKKQKKKKVVDTKASKGRKIRYEPHEKLQHFMVPVPVRGGWHEEQIDELFASLLGKGFEEAGADTAVPAPTEEGQILQGFRVFG